MKIGIYDPYLDSVSGGEKYMVKSALCLAQKHNVTIFWDPAQAISIKNKFRERFGYDLSMIEFVPNIFSRSTTFITRMLASKKYDKIFYLSDGSIPIVRSQLYLHFQFPVEWVNGRSFRNKFKLHRVSKIICNSFFTKSYIDKKFSVDSVVIYPPIETAYANAFEKENIILNVGRFGQTIEGSNFKKQDLMIDVFKKMIDSGLRLWKLLLVISFNEQDREKVQVLHKMAEGYPIEIFENQNSIQVKEWYEKAKIYWHATGYGEDLQNHPERAEHFGISTVEAMAHKAVPVVINAGGQKEIVEEGKNGFLWNTTEELMQKTNQLVQNFDLLTTLRESAATSAERFNEKRFCEELEKTFGIT